MLTPESKADRDIVNNDYYHSLGQRWYTAKDDPVALLRAESRTRNPWIHELIQSYYSVEQAHILDVGCGAGFLSNFLSEKGFKVTGIDLSQESLQVARLRDPTLKATYTYADAYQLPFANQSFEVVTCTDFLEHVSKPQLVLSEIERVLKPGGLFFFHTFNKNLLAWLIVIKGVEWFVKNTPKNLHVLGMFIKPEDLIRDLEDLHFSVKEVKGLRPRLNSSFWELLATGIVSDSFEFQWTRSTLMSYTGWAQKPF